MEGITAIAGVLGSIVVAIITGLVSLRIQAQRYEEHRQELINARLLQAEALDAAEGVKQSDAAQKLSESAVGIVDRYEIQCERMMQEIQFLKAEIKELQGFRESDKKELERLSSELTISEIFSNHLLEVNNMLIKQIIEEAHLVPVAQAKTKDEIRSSMQ
jgi:hypothetical protein